MASIDIKLLRGISLFERMTDAELTQLADLLQPQTFTPNQPIFWIGDRGTDFYIIQSGHVELLYMDEDGKEKTLATLGHGQFFGELSLLDGGPRTASARSVSQTELFLLGRADFENYLLNHATAAFHILTVLGRRQRDMLDRLKSIKNVNQVIAAEKSRWHFVADIVAGGMASPYFIVAQIGIVLVWVTVNSFLKRAFDSYPFSLLSLVVSVEALFLSAFLLVSQGRQAERDRIQADLDYRVNLKAHLEVMQLHQKIDRLEGLMKAQAGAGEEVDQTV
jgi:CRP/FNR family transcriptional regulator, cyclic AMP receptor protein